MKCLLCGEEFTPGQMSYKLKKQTPKGSYRTTNLRMHQSCVNKMVWNRSYSHIKLSDFVLDNLHMTSGHKGEDGWRIDKYRITKFTQENIDRMEKNLIKKTAKKELLK